MMTPEEFESKLDAISFHGGVAYGRAHGVFEAQDAHALEALALKGHLALSDAFKCVFLEAVECSNTGSGTASSEWYGLFVQRMVHAFQSLCATDTVAIKGYPFHAYTLLRNTFDNVQLSSAVMQGITTFRDVLGIEADREYDHRSAAKARKRSEATVKRWMSGSDSKLSKSTMDELARWDRMFDDEVHGARLSMTEAGNWLRGAAPLPVVPAFSLTAYTMYINRFAEVAWMTHRLLPLIQIPGHPFTPDWRCRWRLLDECCAASVNAVTVESGKGIGAALVEYVEAKYPFNEESVFPLEAGTQ